MNDKFILDATAGYRMMWNNKFHPNTIFLDKRPEVKPDIIGSFNNIPLEDSSMKLIVFDPQFREKKHGCPKGFEKSYGELLKPDWEIDFRKAFKEFWRVLENYGILIFKWNDAKISSKRALLCFDQKPLFSQTTTGTKGRKDKKTYWFCFMKIPKKESLKNET